MRILIIDQCSGSKNYPSHLKAIEKDVIDEHSLDDLLNQDDVLGIEAKELYTGRQQQKIDEAVQMFKQNDHEVERYYVSAGFGLVHEDDVLPPYDVTFAEMSNAEIADRAEQLGIPNDVSTVLQAEGSYDIVYFALGSDYYRSINLESALEKVPDKSTAIVFNNKAMAEQFSNTVSISARTKDAKRFGTIVVALKGIYLKNLARELGTGEATTAEELVEFCLSEKSSQTRFREFT